MALVNTKRHFFNRSFFLFWIQLHHHHLQFLQIRAILRLAEQMLVVVRNMQWLPANVCPSTREIRTKVVDLSVLSVQIVSWARRASEINVKILARVHAAYPLFAQYQIIFLFVTAQREQRATPSELVILYQKVGGKIHLRLDDRRSLSATWIVLRLY